MKKIILMLMLPFALLLGACNGGGQSANEEKEKEAVEIKAVDSLTTEMDNIQSEIETKSDELDEALNALDSDK